MLNVWEKDFSTFIDKHIDFLNENLEDQDNYSLKFSEILENMDIFNSNNEENNQNDNTDVLSNPSTSSDQSNSNMSA